MENFIEPSDSPSSVDKSSSVASTSSTTKLYSHSSNAESQSARHSSSPSVHKRVHSS